MLGFDYLLFLGKKDVQGGHPAALYSLDLGLSFASLIYFAVFTFDRPVVYFVLTLCVAQPLFVQFYSSINTRQLNVKTQQSSRYIVVKSMINI